jgi:hypothetical protein
MKNRMVVETDDEEKKHDCHDAMHELSKFEASGQRKTHC